jgi:hypothetical protein
MLTLLLLPPPLPPLPLLLLLLLLLPLLLLPWLILVLLPAAAGLRWSSANMQWHPQREPGASWLQAYASWLLSLYLFADQYAQLATLRNNRPFSFDIHHEQYIMCNH